MHRDRFQARWLLGQGLLSWPILEQALKRASRSGPTDLLDLLVSEGLLDQETSIQARAEVQAEFSRDLSASPNTHETSALDSDILPGYVIEKVMDRGAMGAVYRGRRLEDQSPVAIKIMLDSDPSEIEIERFRREIQVLTSLEHPHILEILDAGFHNRRFYIVTELIEGQSLQEFIDERLRSQGPPSWQDMLPIFRGLAEAVAFCHQRAIIHRDIKPANLFVCKLGLEFDFLKVLDFGIVREEEEGDGKLTGQGNFVGTASYVAPEIVMGRQDYDGRADLYSLACVAYWLLTGRVVFDGETPMAVVIKHASEAPIPPSNITQNPIPKAFESLVMACLEKAPDDRPKDAHDLWRKLGALTMEESWDQDRAEDWWRKNAPKNLEFEGD